jgi:hypothetical protein
VTGVGSEDLGDCRSCVLPDAILEGCFGGPTDQQMDLRERISTSSLSLFEAESSLRVFLDSAFPLCSARARVAKDHLLLLSS